MTAVFERGRGGVQATTDQAGLFREADLKARGDQAVRAMCYVTENGKHRGTGFLVGPDLVLTCHHVVGGLPPGEVDRGRFACVFDATGSSWKSVKQRGPLVVTKVVACSRVSTFEAEFDDGRQGLDDIVAATADDYLENGEPCLDYALLRVTPVAGHDVLRERENPDLRGWIGLPTAEPRLFFDTNPTYVFILQFPKLERADDAVPQLFRSHGSLSHPVQHDGKLLRARYGNTTEPGSSGGAVFDGNFRLIGLHNFGYSDPVSGKRLTFRGLNQCVPLWGILQTWPADIREEITKAESQLARLRADAARREAQRAERRIDVKTGAEQIANVLRSTIDRVDARERIVFPVSRGGDPVYINHIIAQSKVDDARGFLRHLHLALGFSRRKAAFAEALRELLRNPDPDFVPAAIEANTWPSELELAAKPWRLDELTGTFRSSIESAARQDCPIVALVDADAATLSPEAQLPIFKCLENAITLSLQANPTAIIPQFLVVHELLASDAQDQAVPTRLEFGQTLRYFGDSIRIGGLGKGDVRNWRDNLQECLGDRGDDPEIETQLASVDGAISASFDLAPSVGMAPLVTQLRDPIRAIARAITETELS